MDPDDSSKLKFAFVSLNSIFVLIGAAIFAVGAYIFFAFQQPYVDFVGDCIWIVATIFMVAGGAIALISIVGCCGALKENYCTLLLFSIILATVFVTHVAGIVTLATQKIEVDRFMEQKLNETFLNYDDNKDSTLAWKLLQSELRCCGIYGPMDWDNQYPGKPLPKSCCHEMPADASQCTNEWAEKQGCLSTLKDWLHGKAILFIAFGLAMSLIPLMFLCCACRLCTPFKRRYESV